MLGVVDLIVDEVLGSLLREEDAGGVDLQRYVPSDGLVLPGGVEVGGVGEKAGHYALQDRVRVSGCDHLNFKSAHRLQQLLS